MSRCYVLISLFVMQVGVCFAADLSGTWEDDWDGSVIEVSQQGIRLSFRMVREVEFHPWESGQGVVRGTSIDLTFKMRPGFVASSTRARISSDGRKLSFGDDPGWTKLADQKAKHTDQPPSALEVFNHRGNPNFNGHYVQTRDTINGWPVYAMDNRSRSARSAYRYNYLYRHVSNGRLVWVLQQIKPDARKWQANAFNSARLPWEGTWQGDWNARNIQVEPAEDRPDAPAAMEISNFPDRRYNGVYHPQPQEFNGWPVYALENPEEPLTSPFHVIFLFRQNFNQQLLRWVVQPYEPHDGRWQAQGYTDDELPWDASWFPRGVQVTRLDKGQGHTHGGYKPPPVATKPNPSQPTPTPGTVIRTRNVPLIVSHWGTRSDRRWLEGPKRIGGLSGNATDGWNYPQRGVVIDRAMAESKTSANAFSVLFTIPATMKRLRALDVVVAGDGGTATVGFAGQPFKEHITTRVGMSKETLVHFPAEKLNLARGDVQQIEIFVRGNGVRVDGIKATALIQE